MFGGVSWARPTYGAGFWVPFDPWTAMGSQLSKAQDSKFEDAQGFEHQVHMRLCASSHENEVSAVVFLEIRVDLLDGRAGPESLQTIGAQRDHRLVLLDFLGRRFANTCVRLITYRTSQI